jgi:hypothetical protein
MWKRIFRKKMIIVNWRGFSEIWPLSFFRARRKNNDFHTNYHLNYSKWINSWCQMNHEQIKCFYWYLNDLLEIHVVYSISLSLVFLIKKNYFIFYISILWPWINKQSKSFSWYLARKILYSIWNVKCRKNQRLCQM